MPLRSHNILEGTPGMLYRPAARSLLSAPRPFRHPENAGLPVRSLPLALSFTFSVSSRHGADPSLNKRWNIPHINGSNWMPKAKKGPKFYAVKAGRKPGIYTAWDEASRQVSGFPGNIYKSFASEQEALDYMATPSAAAPGFKLDQGQAPPSLAQIRSQLSSIKASQTQISPIVVEAEQEPTLNEEQKLVLDKVLAGKNVFFTGSAGTGKSVLLRAIIAAFQTRELEAQSRVFTGDGEGSKADPNRWKLGITASTGMAAVNIGGTTLHSWANVGLFNKPVEAAVVIIRQGKANEALKRWLESQALMIDEVSMISGLHLDYLDRLGRILRGDSRPFGGLQVILSGDFYQLPPVGQPVVFAFQAQCWDSLIPLDNQHDLTKVYRQTDDTFVKLLEKMRFGTVNSSDADILRGLSRKLEYEDRIEPVGLYATRAEVDSINDERLRGLRKELVPFHSFDVPGTHSEGYPVTIEAAIKKLNSHTKFPQSIDICEGALVMLIKNLKNDDLVNGSTGIVVGFATLQEAKQRGIPIPQTQFNFSPVLDPVKTKYPVVEFAPTKHGRFAGTRKFLIPAMGVDVQNANLVAEATRYQIPLILAWALTIHKSQGQTLERVKVDMGCIFERGQTYVAISRAVSMDGLELHNFHSDRVQAHPEVREWDKMRKAAKANELEWEYVS